MGEKVGNAVEIHIQEALEHIFHSDNVTKLDSEGKHADFLISLDKINIIIEVKSMIGSMSEKTVMRPDQQAKMWNRFYGACQQCAHSAKETKESGKQTIAMVTEILFDSIVRE